MALADYQPYPVTPQRCPHCGVPLLYAGCLIPPGLRSVCGECGGIINEGSQRIKWQEPADPSWHGDVP